MARHLAALVRSRLVDRDSLPTAARDLLVALGPAYVKLGQVLSTRVDALPPEWTSALAGLRDALPPEPWATVAPVLERALGAEAAGIAPVPVAAGSVAQVHRTRLADGRDVAVKVLRPGAGERIAANLTPLLGAARVAQRISRRARVLNVEGIVAELADLLQSQTDLREEARNYRRFSREFAGDETVRLPAVVDALSTADVLVTDFVEGVDPYDVAHLPLTPVQLARRFDELVDDMIFVKGLCHADLHPGNFFWDDEARVVLVDVGLVHRIDKEQRQHLWAFYSALLDGFEDFAAAYVVRHLTTVRNGGQVPEDVTDEVARLVRRHWVESSGRPAFGPMFVELLGVLGWHDLQLRPEHSRLFLTLATVEGYLFSLDPGYDTLENARRKRVEQAEYVAVPPQADELVFQGVATYSAAMFGDGRDARAAWAERDRFVLDTLGVADGTSFLDVGCGRGQLVAAAAARGARAVGVTISPAEHDVCQERGLDVLLTSWQDADRHLGHRQPRFQTMAAVEMDTHLGTLHESRVGLLDLRLARFFGWAHDHLEPGGRLLVQTLSVPGDLVRDEARRPEFERLSDLLPFTGFSTLPQMVAAADRWFTVEQVLDHSRDLLPTYEFWRDNVNRQLPSLRRVVRAETIVLVRRHLDTLIGLAESGTLRLHRLVLHARALEGRARG
ncbi:AarF/UbiB family protein [Geodermatophilus sp. SYSU D01106]